MVAFMDSPNQNTMEYPNQITKSRYPKHNRNRRSTIEIDAMSNDQIVLKKCIYHQTLSRSFEFGLNPFNIRSDLAVLQSTTLANHISPHPTSWTPSIRPICQSNSTNKIALSSQLVDARTAPSCQSSPSTFDAWPSLVTWPVTTVVKIAGQHLGDNVTTAVSTPGWQWPRHWPLRRLAIPPPVTWPVITAVNVSSRDPWSPDNTWATMTSHHCSDHWHNCHHRSTPGRLWPIWLMALDQGQHLEESTPWRLLPVTMWPVHDPVDFLKKSRFLGQSQII